MTQAIIEKSEQSSHSGGASVLTFIQLFSTLGYAVLYSTLVLYMTTALGFSETVANTMMGGFIAFNYGLHLLGGYFGGRFLSYRLLFVIGMVIQFIACLLLAQSEVYYFYWGLACFLTGSGLNVPCINMMLTQMLQNDHTKREGAFLWNYSGMNVGFFLGFALAGYFQLKSDYSTLFLVSSGGNLIALAITLLSWRKLADKTTVLSKQASKEAIRLGIFGTSLCLLMIPTIRILFHYAKLGNSVIIGMGILMFAFLIWVALTQESAQARNKLFAFVILSSASLLFWALYQIAPMGLTVFAQYNVDRHVFGYLVTPQWIQDINTVVIIFGGPSMFILFQRMRAKGVNINIPVQFACSLVLIGLGFVVIPMGISFADEHGLVAFNWIFLSYILQSVGELLISPIGYAMIARLAPADLQGILMGTWMMISGVAGVLSSKFSNLAISETATTDPLLTNNGYYETFGLLGLSAIALGIALFVFTPFIKRLLSDETVVKPVPVSV